MKYADPHACPACRGVISGGNRCPHCDFDLGSLQARRLWGLFVEADRLVVEGRSVASPPPEATPPTGQLHGGSMPGDSVLVGSGAPTAAPVPVRPSWSTGSILLGLGAVCLIVAGIIFASVAWGSLGILGRAAILLAVTAVVGVCAAWATRRRLFGTAEALWTVFLGLITVDVLAAVAEGLFGLDWGDFAVVSVGWTVVIVGAGVAIVRWARAAFEHDLVMPQLAAGLAPWISAPALMNRLGESSDENLWFWAALVSLMIPVAVLVVSRRLRLTWTFWPVAILSVCFVAVLVALAIEAAFWDEPLLTFFEALPTLTLAAAAVVAGVLGRPARSWAGGFAAVAAFFLLGVAATGWAGELEVSESAGLVAVAIVVALVALFAVKTDAWFLGVRWAAVIVGAALLLWALGVATSNLERIDKAAWFSSPADVWVRPTEMAITEGTWVVAVVAALLVGWWGLRRWTSPRVVPSAWWTPLALIAGGAAVVTAVASSLLPFLVHSAVLTAVGAALAVGVRRSPWAFGLVPPGVIGLAMVVVPTDATVTAWAWGLATAGFAVCALVGFDDPSDVRRGISAVSAGLTTGAAIATIGQVVDQVGVDRGWWSTVIAAGAAAALLLTLALDEAPWHRVAVEVVAAAALAVAVLSAPDLATVSLLFTIGAVAAGLVGLLDDDRTYLRWVAAGLVGCAWIARLAANEVQTVEAYTAPFAVALLAAGVWRLRTDSGSRTWTVLTPGLTLALLPSLPQALADPTSLRAGLLALVAAAVLAVGVLLRWGSPVAAGSIVLLVLVLANVGPTALALQRWILIAIAGLVLLVVGTTWEKRVAEGRALIARLTALR